MGFDSGVTVYITAVGDDYADVLLNINKENRDKTQLDWIDGAPAISATTLNLDAGIPGSVYVAAGDDLRLFILGNGQFEPNALLAIAREMMPLSKRPEVKGPPAPSR